MKTRWPAPRSRHLLAEQPREHDRRPQVHLQRAVDLLRRVVRAAGPDPGSAALATRTSTSRARARRAARRRRGRTGRRRARASRRRAPRRAARARPCGARSGRASAPARCRRRAIAWPMPPVAPGEQHRPSRDDHRRSLAAGAARQSPAKTATVAVNPCRKFSPPTGPISPAAKKPGGRRAAAAPRRRRRRRGRACRTCPRPRPLHVKTSAPGADRRRAPSGAARAPSAGRGRRSRRRARAGGRPAPRRPARRR